MKKHEFKYEPVNMFRPHVCMDQVKESKTGSNNAWLGFAVLFAFIVAAGVAFWVNSLIN